MTPVEIVRQRLVNSHLAGGTAASAAEVVRRLCAVQSQDYAAATWAVAQRTDGVTQKEMDALLEEGVILRTHVLRPTWHFVLPEDIRWLLRLTAPQVKAAMASTNRTLGLDDRVFAESNAILAGVLRGGGRVVRRELVEAYGQGGIDAGGIRLAHLLMRAELDGVLCSGGLRGRQFTYALLDERIPPTGPVDIEEPLARLATRYLAGHGPARTADLAWWSGLTMRQAQRGIDLAAGSLITMTVDRRDYHRAADAAAAPARTGALVSLVPNYDEYLVGYRDRTLHLGPSAAVPATRLGLLGSSVVLDGHVVGTWRSRLEAGEARVEADLDVPLTLSQRAALQAQTDRYGRFLGRPAALSIPSA